MYTVFRSRCGAAARWEPHVSTRESTTALRGNELLQVLNMWRTRVAKAQKGFLLSRSGAGACRANHVLNQMKRLE